MYASGMRPRLGRGSREFESPCSDGRVTVVEFHPCPTNGQVVKCLTRSHKQPKHAEMGAVL